MKTIYSDPVTYQAFLEQSAAGNRIATETGVFDGMSDEEINTQRYVPQGYVFTDPATGLHYHGQATMPMETFEGSMAARVQEAVDGVTELQLAMAEMYEMMAGAEEV